MFEIKKKLSNSRPAKSNALVVHTTTAGGSIKLSESVGEAMNIKKGDYIGVVQGADELFYLYKGKEGKNGSSNDGSKVATANDKGAGTMQFSSANAFQALGGNKETIEIFTIGEGVQHEDKTYFVLKFVESRAKQIRKTKETVETV